MNSTNLDSINYSGIENRRNNFEFLNLFDKNFQLSTTSITRQNNYLILSRDQVLSTNVTTKLFPLFKTPKTLKTN